MIHNPDRFPYHDRQQMEEHQLDQLNRLLGGILGANRFYDERIGPLDLPLRSWDEFYKFPYTTKDELIGEDGIATNLTWEPEGDAYHHVHRTSGTRGQPLIVLDTSEDWLWWKNLWQFVLDAAEIRHGDRAMMAFSFGPYIGFWSAYHALQARGVMAIPGGGLSTLARLQIMRSVQATVLCCTPSYALHMAEVGRQQGIATEELHVEEVIVAGEPGGSIPAIRQRIKESWNAEVIDHAGATEVGPWGYGDDSGEGLFVIEREFKPEFISIKHGGPAAEGELAELVITTFGRIGCPVIRYRTGDLVRPSWKRESPYGFVFLEGGVLGRVDDMLIVRGVNIYPSAIEQIVRGFPEVDEYRMTARKVGQLDTVAIEVEDHLQQPQRIADQLELRLGLRVDVQCVPTGTLPRFEEKGRRFVDERR